MAPALFIDLMSQPSRACYIMCKLHGLPVELHKMRLDRGDQRKPEYLELNPLGKVPLLVDGALQLPESASIMCYLAAVYGLPHEWAPPLGGRSPGSSDSATGDAAAQRRARFDAALAWQHTTIRLGCTRLVFNTVIGPRVFGAPASPVVAAHGATVLRQALSDMEAVWLKGGGFLTGDKLSIPDLLVACELEQLRCVRPVNCSTGYRTRSSPALLLPAGPPPPPPAHMGSLMVAEPDAPQMEALLAPHPGVRAWLSRVRTAAGSGLWDDAHSTLAAAATRFSSHPPRQGGGSGKL